jgi:hypothetical protein
MAPKLTTTFLLLGMLGLLAVSACLADTLPQPHGATMAPTVAVAPARKLLYVFCHDDQGNQYKFSTYHNGLYCCKQGRWVTHPCF